MTGERPDQPATGSAARLNRLRAGVLGANDGIVSVAGLVVGVASATSARGPILIAGVAGLVAGVVSMALGEYVSVSSQRDTERALVEQERRLLQLAPDDELAELESMYRARGLSEATARTVAAELTARDAFAAHADAELRLNPNELINPWEATIASAVSFTLGAVLPLIAILLAPPSQRIPVTFATVLVALALTGAVSARLGAAPVRTAVLRLVVGGAAGYW